MQGIAMNLRRDFVQWQKDSGAAVIGHAPWGDGRFTELAKTTTRSDFRHLASHCDTALDPTLVCMRDATDESQGHPFECLPGGREGDACDSDPGTYGEGRNSCAPGFECYFDRCQLHVTTGGACTPEDTGENDDARIVRCDWRHRAPQYSMIECPVQGPAAEDGIGVECRQVAGSGPWYLIDNLDGEFVRYVQEYDNGCENVHHVNMCRLVVDQAHDVAYCDGSDGA